LFKLIVSSVSVGQFLASVPVVLGPIPGIATFKLIVSYIPTASVVYWPKFLATDPEVPGSIPGIITFSVKQWVLNGVHSAS
jgi:hypothetical protein